MHTWGACAVERCVTCDNGGNVWVDTPHKSWAALSRSVMQDSPDMPSGPFEGVCSARQNTDLERDSTLASLSDLLVRMAHMRKVCLLWSILVSSLWFRDPPTAAAMEHAGAISVSMMQSVCGRD